MNFGRLGRDILRQVIINGTLTETELKRKDGKPYSSHTVKKWRKTYEKHKVIRLKKDSADHPYEVGRPRYVWVPEINGIILALKNNLVKPNEVATTLKTQILEWLNLTLKEVHSPQVKKALKRLFSLHIMSFDDDPERFCDLLKMFDFEFCHDPPQTWFVIFCLVIATGQTLGSTKRGLGRLTQYEKDIRKILKYLGKKMT